ncbi:Na+/H+ antiporter NhaC family protein [Halorubrum sp. LN27]|uniref:Na+/H+ antiporter NhaC family protein n=1 Tax=Halorubrum sp. LN27 TaxID=2801032 RepID=UPI001F3E25D0|nr:Na+/H+ antiporter NhaC family protein [Halorubrum sp. LN27]
MTTTYGALSLAPPLVAIALAMYTRRTLVSLFAGVWIGALLVADWNPIAATALANDWLVEVVLSPFNAKFLLLILFMGAGAAFIYRSGGVLALERWVADHVNTARDSQLLTWALGVFLFFDSYTSTIVTGNATRDLARRNETSTEMHSYVLDSTTSPVTTFGPISNWIGFQVSMIVVGFEAIDATAGDYGVTPFELFIRSIPWNVYCFMAFFMVGLIAFTQRFYGPMLNAEWRSRAEGKPLRDDATPLSDVSSDVGEPSEANPRLANFFLPLVALIVVGIVSLWWLGGGADPGVSLAESFEETDVALGLLYGAFAFMVTGFAGAVGFRTMDVEEASETMVDGFETMVIAAAIIVLAWGIGHAAEQVGTADYVVDLLVSGGVPAGVLPILIFLAAMLVSFTTGTSWGTMSILTPLAIPLGLELGGIELLPVLLGVLFGGAIWGDHCSPISDTTVMSSIFAGADHIDHVNTQVPFALTAAGVTLGVLGLYAAGVRQIALLFPLAVALTVVAVFALNRIDARRKGLPEVMPTAAEIDAADAVGDGTETKGGAGVEGSYALVSPVAAGALVVVVAYLIFLAGFFALGGGA